MYNELKTKRLKSMKNDKATYQVLTTLIGEIDRGSSKTDKDCQAKILKMIKDLNFNIEHSTNNDLAKSELEILKSLLPNMLSEDELKNLVQKLVSEGAGKKEIFQYIKANDLIVDSALVNKLL